MWDGFNKRKFPRLKLDCEIVIYPKGQEKALQATTENVGLGGVSAILEEPLERFENCKVKIDLKDEEIPIQCSGKVVWIITSRDLISSKETFDTGIEFMDIDQAAREKLKTFLKQHPNKEI